MIEGYRDCLAYQRPVTVHGVEISVTDTRVLDVDKNLIWARLLDGNLLVLYGTTGLLDDLRPLLLWDFWHCDVVRKLGNFGYQGKR